MGHGSNIDLQTAQEIDHDLRESSKQIDQALELMLKALSMKHGSKEDLGAEAEHEKAYAREYLSSREAEESVTDARMRAQYKTAKEFAARAKADGLVEYAKALLRTRQSQMSAAQTRSKLFLAQISADFQDD